MNELITKDIIEMYVDSDIIDEILKNHGGEWHTVQGIEREPLMFNNTEYSVDCIDLILGYRNCPDSIMVTFTPHLTRGEHFELWSLSDPDVDRIKKEIREFILSYRLEGRICTKK